MELLETEKIKLSTEVRNLNTLLLERDNVTRGLVSNMEELGRQQQSTFQKQMQKEQEELRTRLQESQRNEKQSSQQIEALEKLVDQLKGQNMLFEGRYRKN